MDQDGYWADESIQHEVAANNNNTNTTNTTTSSGKPKRFQCTHAGCSKRFTRMEHMQRHALNHTTGESTCPRCHAHFKRPDLLGMSCSIPSSPL